MPQIQFLQDLIIIFGLSVAIVLIFQRLHLPSIVGFLISGALLGPYGLNLIDDIHQVEVLAEVGIVLLLFTIGLEFSLARLSRIRAFVISGGSLQVGLTIMLTAIIAWIFQLPMGVGIFWGFLLALSSTAIVLKLLMDREELDTPHGRLAVGILIFQDIIVLPMILIAPMLTESAIGDLGPVLFALGRSVLLVLAILIMARWLVPKILALVVRAQSREIFVITVILICLVIAWLSSKSGLTLALGAFIAGLVISESEYSHQALADIMPLRHSFNSLFFISIGMLLDVRFFLENPLLVISMGVVVLMVKGLIAGGVTLALGYPARVAALVGVYLAQVGEFSFILAQTGQDLGLLVGDNYQLFLGTSILTMIAAPFLIQISPKLVGRTELRKDMLHGFKSRKPFDLAPHNLPLHHHVIIAGYGLNGRNMARVLKEAEIPYVILDIQGDMVRHARSQGEPIYFGDATRIRVLRHVRIQEAKVLVLAVSDPFAVRRAIHITRHANPDIHIIVRTRYLKEVDELLQIGANEVVPEEFETSLEIFGLVLQQYRVPERQIFEKKQKIRREGYEKLRRGEIERYTSHRDIPTIQKIECYVVKKGSPLSHKTLTEVALPHSNSALLVAIIRDDETHTDPGGGFQLQPDDTLILVGTKEALDRAIGHLEAFEEADEPIK